MINSSFALQLDIKSINYTLINGLFLSQYNYDKLLLLLLLMFDFTCYRPKHTDSIPTIYVSILCLLELYGFATKFTCKQTNNIFVVEHRCNTQHFSMCSIYICGMKSSAQTHTHHLNIENPEDAQSKPPPVCVPPKNYINIELHGYFFEMSCRPFLTHSPRCRQCFSSFTF